MSSSMEWRWLPVVWGLVVGAGGDAWGAPPNGDARGAPPNGDARGAPPNGDARGAPQNGDAWGAPPSEREARSWLALPKLSTSLGRTNEGQLVGAATLAERGVGHVVLSHAAARRTNFGTAELVAVIERATRAVRERYPGSVLGIGNLGFEDGRKIPWSVSHQAGRDADLGMYATTEDGRPIQAMAFHEFDAEGFATGPGGRKVRFDVARNLALVVALVEDSAARVQYLFVATWLKDKLLAEAVREGVAPQTIARLQEVLHQPSDSNPHADHFHLRLFCSVEDRLYGCINRGPPRAWVDPGDREHAEAARRIATILEMDGRGAEALKVRALERLAAMQAASEVDAVVKALSSRSKKVRKAALAAVIGIGDARAAEGIAKVLREVSDAVWATALFAAIPELDAATLVPLAERVLAPGGAEALLHPKALPRARGPVERAALAVVRDHGEARHIPVLLGYAEDGAARERATKKAAIEALAHRTCQPLASAKAFRAWYAESGAGGELAWIESGLGRALGSHGLRSKDGVERLIRLLDKRDPATRACAWRALVALTGPDEDWRARPPVRNRKHWESWWREHASLSSLP
jgi:penicillin-insensitive murein endopeptidase